MWPIHHNFPALRFVAAILAAFSLAFFAALCFAQNSAMALDGTAADPDNFDAHYNLANALASQGQFSEAIIHYRAATRLRPDDANAEANLGTALAEAGNLPEAKLHLERALHINPSHELARENLAEINLRLGARNP